MQMQDFINDLSNMKYKGAKQYIDFIKKDYKTYKKESIKILIDKLNEDSRKNINSLGETLNKHINKYDQELNRVLDMYKLDKSYYPYTVIAGVDEVGRGPLAGPIVAASVVLDLKCDEENLLFDIKDSKKLSHKKREELDKIIRQKAIKYNIAALDNNVIDQRGIAWSNNEVLKRAVYGLTFTPDLVLSDGYAVKNINIPNEFIIKGDNKSASIACASIIAKVYRDKLMEEYAKIYPEYGFDRNSGYGTAEHIEAIKKYGPCKIHRKSFLKNII